MFFLLFWEFAGTEMLVLVQLLDVLRLFLCKLDYSSNTCLICVLILFWNIWIQFGHWFRNNNVLLVFQKFECGDTILTRSLPLGCWFFLFGAMLRTIHLEQESYCLEVIKMFLVWGNQRCYLLNIFWCFIINNAFQWK